MQYLLFLVLISILGMNPLNGQWNKVSTNTTENLYDIIFVDSLEGYCVGGTDTWGTPQSTGVILKTTDGGENWSTGFSIDSMTINQIAIIEANGNKKLHAFALKNGDSYLISTFIHTPFQNWSVNSINYKPKGVKVYDNEIFFVDETDYFLKKITNGNVQNVTSKLVPIFDVNAFGLLFVNENAERVFYSSDMGNTIDTLSPHPVEFGQNQIYQAQAKLVDSNTIIVMGTYPLSNIVSFDLGQNWIYNRTGVSNPYILNTNEIWGRRIVKTNYTGSFFEIQDSTITVNINKIEFFKTNIGFAIGDYGSIYKTVNGGTLLEIKEGMFF